ncbi:MAG: flagellar biosynthetic protein FliR [Alphaproteobacteria bacterium]
MLNEILTADVFAIGLVFARIGAAMMLLPGFAESYVSPRIRLLISLALSIVITPVVSPHLPPMPPSLLGAAALIIGEIIYGIFLGGLTRLLISALHVAGVVIGFQTSLSNATFFDPSNSQQGALIAAFFNILGVFMIFVTDLHHLMLMAIADSYTLFAPGGPIPFDSFSEIVVRVLADSFKLGIQLAAPFLEVGTVFYAGLGLLGRLMPQVQVFFIAIPLQIMLAFIVMSMTLSAGMFWFLSRFEDNLLRFTGQG